MSKQDLRKELREYYTAKRKPELVDVPEGVFLTITGQGDPGGDEYMQAMMALYGAAYTLKFRQKEQGRDFTVMGLEGLWWTDDMVFDPTDPANRATWRWKSMIRQPGWVTRDMLDEVLPELREKRGGKVDEVRVEKFYEGMSAHVMHVGPYSEEGPTIELLHGWVEEQGYRLRGRHHEIYLNDPRRTKPEKITTILRHPVEKA
ncbi:MAG: GyrI-like domain-containing protein [Candidatus Bathyarchaeota archaeon]